MEYKRDFTVQADLVPCKIPVVEQPNKGGLGIAELRKDPPEPVIVTAPLLSSVAVNSTLVLFWDNIQVDSYTLTEDQHNSGLIVFNVRPNQIQDSDRAELIYQIYSPVGGNPAVSDPYYVRVNTKAPGNPPLNSTDPINHNLTAPRGIPDPITDAIAAQGVDVLIDPWLPLTHMEVGDVLTLTWGQTKITMPPLTADQIGKVMTVHVPESVILATPNTLNLQVFYDIRDNVGNWSLLSPSAKTDIEAGPNTLPAPRVVDAVGDNDIDLAELGTADVRVLIPVYTPWSAGDRVTLYWYGTTLQGAEVNETRTYTMLGSDEGFPVELKISNAAAVAIAGGRAIVYYEVNGVRRSKRTAITVSGAVQDLPPPDVSEAVGGLLDPANVLPAGATVIVHAYAGMSSADKIILYWSGTTADGGSTFYTAEQPGNSVGRDVVFYVPKAQHVDSLAGGSVVLYYHVTTAQNVGRDSDTRTLLVKASQPDPGLDLRRPEVPAAYGIDHDHLNFASAMYSDQHLLVTVSYTGMAVGQKVRLNWDGTVRYTEELPVNTIGTLQFFVPRLEVVDMIGRTVTITYTVTLANGSSGGTSPPLYLGIDPQSQDLAPPRISVGSQTAIVQYTGMSSAQTVRVAWWGVVSRVTEELTGSNSGTLSFNIPASWINENAGREVLVNYTTHRIGSGEGTLEFSRVLRHRV